MPGPSRFWLRAITRSVVGTPGNMDNGGHFALLHRSYNRAELLPTVADDLYPWSPRDLPRAKAIMQYNLATAHTIRGEYEKALMHLTKVCKFSPELICEKPLTVNPATMHNSASRLSNFTTKVVLKQELCQNGTSGGYHKVVSDAMYPHLLFETTKLPH